MISCKEITLNKLLHIQVFPWGIGWLWAAAGIVQVGIMAGYGIWKYAASRDNANRVEVLQITDPVYVELTTCMMKANENKTASAA